MTWVKLDDGFFENRKTMAAGRDGKLLYLAGLCFCARSLTDGIIPDEALPIVAAQAGVKPSISRRLVELGLWQRTGGSHAVPDYLDYNPSAERVREERTATAERVRRFRAGKRTRNTSRNNVTADVSHGDDNESGNALGNDGVTPSPSPTPSNKSSSDKRGLLPTAAKIEEDQHRKTDRNTDQTPDIWTELAQRKYELLFEDDDNPDRRDPPPPGPRRQAWLTTTADGYRHQHETDHAANRAEPAHHDRPLDFHIWLLEPTLAERNWQIPSHEETQARIAAEDAELAAKGGPAPMPPSVREALRKHRGADRHHTDLRTAAPQLGHPPEPVHPTNPAPPETTS